MAVDKATLITYRIARSKETVSEAENAIAGIFFFNAENRIYYAMFYIKIFFLLIISSVVHAEIIPQVFKIKTVDNREIVADLYRSDKSGKLPGLVICPGQGYHRQLPLITELANKACMVIMV